MESAVFSARSLRWALVCAGACSLGGVEPALAHHSAAMFDMHQCLTLSGSVRKFQFGFPHSWLWVDVTGSDGKVVTWMLESASPAQMIEVDSHWSKTVVRPGDKVTARYSPERNGEPAGSLAALTIPDGRQLRAATPACNDVLGAPRTPAEK